MTFNPGLNLEAFATQSASAAPPSINTVYLRDGKYDDESTRAGVAATFAAFRSQTATERLALFFHGGLVDKASGQQGAANEYDVYKNFAFPLFFIWESGIWELLAHHLPLVFEETIFGRIVDHATDLVSSKIPQLQVSPTVNQASALEASVRTTETALTKITLTSADVDVFMAAVKSDEKIQREAVAIARTSQGVDSLLGKAGTSDFLQLSPRTYLSPEVVSAIRGAYVQANRANLGAGPTLDALPIDIGGALQAAWAIAKAAVPAITNCVERFAAKRDHGLTCTIVEEVLRALYLANTGSSIWEEMKQETEDAFGADSSVYGGTAVIEELCGQLNQKPSTAVTLIGHSTGAVYIGNFLRHVDIALRAQGDTTTVFDIILLAPANTMDFYASSYTNRIRGIRIFQMQDAAEKEDHLMSKDFGPTDPSILGKVYPRSLLYLVSGVCEYFEGQGGSGVHALDGDDMPILGMDRFYAQSSIFEPADFPSVGQVRAQFAVAPPAVPTKYVRVLSPTVPTPNDGYRSNSQKHGDFPGDQLTQDSIKVCFQQGL
jgi:hypothetical protein